ncbi:MAG: hypothetical protein ACYC5H_09210 [Methylovirgula sp.]
MAALVRKQYYGQLCLGDLDRIMAPISSRRRAFSDRKASSSRQKALKIKKLEHILG